MKLGIFFLLPIVANGMRVKINERYQNDMVNVPEINFNQI